MRAGPRRRLPLLCAASLIALASGALPTRADAAGGSPLSDWLSGIGRAAQAQASGDYAAAEEAARSALRARSRGPGAARAHAALGLALLAKEAPLEAANALEVALGLPVPARARLAHARGEALFAAGEAPAAARLFAESAAGASALALARQARLREAEALLAAGLASHAVPTLEALLREGLGGESAARARLVLGRALRANGDDARAQEALRSLWLELPERPEGAAAGVALAAWRDAGGPVPPESGAEHANRAERLLAMGRPDDALIALAAAERAGEPVADAERVDGLRAAVLLAVGRHADAERAALSLAGATDPGVQRGARLVLARIAARAGRVEEASRFYADVAGSTAPIAGLPEWRQRDIGDESAFLAAWLFYDAGAFERAVPALEAFARANRRSRRADDALWFAAWSRWRMRRWAEADRAFAALSRGPLADAALYWRGRLASSPARQRALYRASLAAAPEGWYALLSRKRLAALGVAAPRPRPPASSAIPDVQDTLAAGRLSVAVELLGLGLREEALGELRDLGRGRAARAAAPQVAQLAAFAEDAELPFRMARDHLQPSRRALRWAYPEPHGDALLRAARGTGIDPSLVLGVMRRESGFRRSVRSGAGAEGLLQLLPATAGRVAAVLGLEGGVGARLDDPETNVSIGAHYLALLLSRFDDPAIAVAAYNAGPSAVAGWATARRGMPIDAWVESIPYRETRQYVKIVLSEWDVYRSLAGAPPPPIDPLRPAPSPVRGVAF